MKLKVPKYQQILEELEARIHSGAYGEGARLPSEADLVQQYGASRLTVARALKELQAKGILVRRVGSGSYVKAREPQAKGHVFGLLIPELGQTEIFEPICQGMMRAREAHPHSLLWGHSRSSHGKLADEAEQLCRHYISQKVSGVFFAPIEYVANMDEINLRIAATLDEAGIPLILLDRCVYSYPNRSKFDVVGIDNRRAGYIVTEHLLKLGCRRIHFIGKPRSAPTVDLRIAGYREAMEFAGLKSAVESVHRIDPAELDAVRAILNRFEPEAFVCGNDHTAAVLMRTLTELGIQVPADVRIVGIDDVKYASLLQVPLTTLHQPCHDLGATAMSAMLERIANPKMPSRDILLGCRLVVRQSCGASGIFAKSAS